MRTVLSSAAKAARCCDTFSGSDLLNRLDGSQLLLEGGDLAEDVLVDGFADLQPGGEARSLLGEPLQSGGDLLHWGVFTVEQYPCETTP